MRRSLRFKVALVFSALIVALLFAQAFGVRALAEAQEEKLIAALIRDDLANVLKSYDADPTLLPPFDASLDGYISQHDSSVGVSPVSMKALPIGIHQIIIDRREIHIAIAPFGQARLYRVYDFSIYEQHFKEAINVLMGGTGIFALLTIWLSYGLSGLLVRQVAGLAVQVKTLEFGRSAPIQPGKYDETELVALVEAFNDYHRRMAEMIEREKEFTGNVSHELRTPLTSIKTSCELLEHDTSIRGKSRTRLRQIDRAANTMHELVNALLTLARDESEQEAEPVAVADLIDSTLRPFTGRLAEKGVTTVVDVDRHLRLLANRSALAIVLSNLIDNAVRYTEHGRIQFSYVDGWLHIDDTGCGVPAQALPHLFDRFYQAASPETAARGAGIGLSIVKKICDRYRWSVELNSEPERGTRVSLRLPQARSI